MKNITYKNKNKKIPIYLEGKSCRDPVKASIYIYIYILKEGISGCSLILDLLSKYIIKRQKFSLRPPLVDDENINPKLES
jgi:hypothetical protein